MKKIIAKPVGMFELFYDLVFVYAISRITAVIHHPVSYLSAILINSNCCNANMALSIALL